ncbi:MAG: glycosyltransferase family 4 protein [Proteobacteria bacterium]|nr:glycosyltransferase family 4 protein [Pseudomonadota bacterium]
MGKKIETVTILLLSPHGKALNDLDHCNREPVGGSETAGMNMARVLGEKGYEVNVITDVNSLGGHSCDVFISLRVWRLFELGMLPGRVNYLWCQDDADQLLVKPLEDESLAGKVFGNIDGIMFISNYQQVRWVSLLHVPVEKIFLTTNGIQLSRFADVDPKTLHERKSRAFYSSTPGRGLERLLSAWPAIIDEVNDAELHVFSSNKVYKTEDTDRYRQMFALAERLPGVHYHGVVGQDRLHKEIKECRALAYPCIFPETSCITAIEALAGGCAVVSTSLGSLPETAWQNPLTAFGEEWINAWSHNLCRVFKDDEYFTRIAGQNLNIAKYYDWEYIAEKWVERFEHDMEKKQ